jgi:hypothetical protein
MYRLSQSNLQNLFRFAIQQKKNFKKHEGTFIHDTARFQMNWPDAF